VTGEIATTVTPEVLHALQSLPETVRDQRSLAVN
jgi:hypothetical protein